MPGDLIIEEGKRGDSMFIMVSGQAMVFVSESDASIREQDRRRDQDDTPLARRSIESSFFPTKTKSLSRIGMLTAGSISGELAMLGVSLIRSATIEAQTICSMWEITQDKALAILERFHDAQNHFANLIVEHLERTVPARILSSPLFRGFDRKFRMLISLYCERRAYFPGQKIAREGQPGDRLYIVNQGRATLQKKGVTVKTYASGSSFGSTVMVGIHKIYPGSLSALQTCHILSVSRTSYQQALEQYPSHAAAQELKRVEKLASEELREAIQRISTRKLIWKRYQCQLFDAQNPETQKMTAQELLERAMQVWSERVKSIAKQRRQRDSERAQYDKMMEQWVRKKSQAREKVRIREEGTEDLRPNTVNAPTSTARRKELVKVLEDWPTPRPSPHYRLRVFGVLHEAAKRPATGAPLLPLLKERKIRKGGGKMVGGEDLHVTIGGATMFSPRVSAIVIDNEKSSQLSQDQWWRNSGSPFDSSDTHAVDRSRQAEKESFRDGGQGPSQADADRPLSSQIGSDFDQCAFEAMCDDDGFAFDDEDVIDYAMPQRLEFASILPAGKNIEKKELVLPKLGVGR